MRISLFILFLLFFGETQAQVFSAKDFILSGGNGAGSVHYHLMDTAGYKSADYAAGINYGLRVDYGLSAWLSVDLHMSATLLITETLFDRFSSCYIYEVGPGINYHVPWKNKWIDLEGGVGFGFTRYLYNGSGIAYEHLDAGGVGFFGNLRPKIYFSKKQRLGGFMYYEFNAFFMNADYVHPGLLMKYYEMDGYYHAAGLGLFYRFGSLRPVAYIDNSQ